VIAGSLATPRTVCGALELYADGSPAPRFIGFMGTEPLPTLGVGSSTTAGWHGYVHSTDFFLANGQIASTNIPLPNTSITPYDPPFGYEMTTDGFASPGVQFTMDMVYEELIYASLLTLWDAASTFDIPVDVLHVYRGGWPGYDGAMLEADAGAPYQLAEGGTVMFDATASTVTYYFDDGQGGYDEETYGVTGDRNIPYWSINGVDIAFGLTPTISYDTLVNGLGLAPGVYDLTLDLDVPIVERQITTTTIEIIPEPASLVLLTLGGLAATGRHRRCRQASRHPWFMRHGICP